MTLGRDLLGIALVAAVGMLLAVPILSVVEPSAPPGATSTSVSTAASLDSWAYGVNRWVNVSRTMPGTAYAVEAYMAWYSMFNSTDTSYSTTMVEVNRTVATTFIAQYAQPDATNPSVKATIFHTGIERDLAFANFTSGARVYQSGAPTPALGLINASANSEQSVNTSAYVTTYLASGPQTTIVNYSATTRAMATIAFSPTLGLIPWNLAVGTHWNSTSNFTANGGWTVDWHYKFTYPNGSKITLSGSPIGARNFGGTIAVNGAVAGSFAMPSGITIPGVSLNVSGPFDLLDGVILVPQAGELFGSAVEPTDGPGYCHTAVQTARLGVALDPSTSHFQFAVASSYFTANDSAGMMAGEMAGGGMGPMLSGNPSDPGTTGTGTVEVAATPMTVQAALNAVATVGSPHYPGGTTTPISAAPTSSTPFWQTRIFLGLVGVIAVAIVIGVAVLVVRRRRRPQA